MKRHERLGSICIAIMRSFIIYNIGVDFVVERLVFLFMVHTPTR